MFRNPRENRALSPSHQVSPSVGRPPSPPSNPAVAKASLQQASLIANAPPLMATRTMPSKSSRTSRPKQTKLDFSKGGVKPGTPKPKVQPNSSILSFFKKTDGPSYETGLFIEGSASRRHLGDGDQSVGWVDSEIFPEAAEESRFNESSSTVKRRKLSRDLGSSDEEKSEPTETPSTDTSDQRAAVDAVKKVPSKRPAGPFLDDSDSEDDEPVNAKLPAPPPISGKNSDSSIEDDAGHSPPMKEEVGEESKSVVPLEPPTLKEESKSLPGDDGFAEFEGIEDFEEFEEGEELDERLFMQEQRRLEMAEAGIEADLDDLDFDEKEAGVKTDIGDVDDGTTLVSDAPVCPICNAGLEGISDQDASVHVNNCLDGNPTPVTKPEPVKKPEDSTTVDGSKKFQRPPKLAKPGQANPFSIDGGSNSSGSSAFAKLMSGHAEDAAWATAAASENASRGKPAYQRTCPFYKILPGFLICVDAFRYGAVEGCNAYFLSHFHSDHYVGLTASWSHGPIYCSKVTANLVKQQLRVDPKWVVALDWETETEVPGTGGVKVYMMPANHCPGSSLYLFEKVVGSGKSPRKQRILHCGDFRACRAHIEHPLLRPDVMDAVTGKTRQQKIDVCYLDTTYLNPKFAFPSQTDVIKACADMCVSLSKVRADETDGWEQMKRNRAGEGINKFVRKAADLDPSDSSNSTYKAARERGKLLVVIGTYSIGKERICLGIARALQSKIFAPPSKRRVVLALEDTELTSLLTTNPREAQVHMTPLFEIRAETLDNYLSDYADTFARAVGFRPTGWNYRPPSTRFTEAPQVSTVLHSPGWKSAFSMRDLVPQRGSTGRAACFGVPYSEHSSFRELTVFCTALRVDKVVPTVNVGSAKSRKRMKAWVDKWAAERKKALYKLPDGEEGL